MPPPGRGLTRSDTLTTIAQAANILPLRDFRANYVQTQHAEWKRHYIDCDNNICSDLRSFGGCVADHLQDTPWKRR